jgi:hypothetical protein
MASRRRAYWGSAWSIVVGVRGVQVVAKVIWAAMTSVLLAGCASVSVRTGKGDPVKEGAYRTAIRGPADALTASASQADQACAGGSNPDQQRCYDDTTAEIEAAQRLQQAMRSVKTPDRFADANGELLQGLDLFVQGLTQRNQGLRDHDAAAYRSGQDRVDQSLTAQRRAFAKYPPDAGISP